MAASRRPTASPVDDPAGPAGPAVAPTEPLPSDDAAGPPEVEHDHDGGDGNLLEVGTARVQAALGRVDRLQQRYRPVAVAFAVFKKFGDDQAGNLAALVAYYTFFSLFPLLLVLVTVAGFVLANNMEARERLLDSALSQFPVVGDELRSNIGAIQGNGAALAIGVIGALWGGMGSVEAMQNAMNSVWNVPRKTRPNFFQSRLRSLLMLLLFAAVIAASTLLSNLAALADAVPVAGRLVLVPLSVALNVALYLGAFRVLTNQPLSLRRLLPGAVAAGVAFSVLQAVGGWYVNHVVQGASRVYGTFAVVLGLLSWLYLLAQVSVMAAELNVVLARDLAPRSLLGEPLTAADRRALEHYAQVEERIPQEDVRAELPPDVAADSGRHDGGDDGPASS